MLISLAKPGELKAQDKDRRERLKLFFENFYDMAPDSAFRYIAEELKSAQKDGDSLAMAHLYGWKGHLYLNTDQHITLQYFFKANKIFEAMGDSTNIADSYRAMGGLNFLSFQRKKELLEKALFVSREIGDTKNEIATYNNLGTAYLAKGDYDSATYYYRKALKTEPGPDSSMTCAMMSSLGYIETERKNHEKGLAYFQKAMNFLPAKKTFSRDIFHGNTILNLINVHIEMEHYDSALYYMKRARSFLNLGTDFQKNFYLVASKLHERTNGYPQALSYYKKLDSLHNTGLQQNPNSLRLIELEYNSRIKKEQMAKLQAERTKERYVRFFLFTVLILIVLFSVIVFRFQKQKARRKRLADQKLMEAHLKNSELERQYLTDELNYTNKELTSFATSIVENHNLISEFRNRIREVSKGNNISHIRRQMQEMDVFLHQVLSTDINRQEFLKRSKELNHSLVFYLKTHYRELTEGDINMLILIFLKFSSKDIAVLYNIEPKSVEQRRYRIRNKLHLKATESFASFFEDVALRSSRKAV